MPSSSIMSGIPMMEGGGAPPKPDPKLTTLASKATGDGPPCTYSLLGADGKPELLGQGAYCAVFKAHVKDSAGGVVSEVAIRQYDRRV